MTTRWRIYVPASGIEKEFVLAAVHLKQIVVLDGIERVAKPPGFRIRSHDLHGPLPEIVVRDTRRPPGDPRRNLQGRREAECDRAAPGRVAAAYSACRFLPHAVLDHGVLMGIQVKGKTLLAEAPTLRHAYGKLSRRVFRKLS